MTTILNYDNINKEEWGSLAKQSSTASPFQTLEYYDFCKQLAFTNLYIRSCCYKQPQGVIFWDTKA